MAPKPKPPSIPISLTTSILILSLSHLLPHLPPAHAQTLTLDTSLPLFSCDPETTWPNGGRCASSGELATYGQTTFVSDSVPGTGGQATGVVSNTAVTVTTGLSDATTSVLPSTASSTPRTASWDSSPPVPTSSQGSAPQRRPGGNRWDNWGSWSHALFPSRKYAHGHGNPHVGHFRFERASQDQFSAVSSINNGPGSGGRGGGGEVADLQDLGRGTRSTSGASAMNDASDAASGVGSGSASITDQGAFSQTITQPSTEEPAPTGVAAPSSASSSFSTSFTFMAPPGPMGEGGRSQGKGGQRSSENLAPTSFATLSSSSSSLSQPDVTQSVAGASGPHTSLPNAAANPETSTSIASQSPTSISSSTWTTSKSSPEFIPPGAMTENGRGRGNEQPAAAQSVADTSSSDQASSLVTNQPQPTEPPRSHTTSRRKTTIARTISVSPVPPSPPDGGGASTPDPAARKDKPAGGAPAEGTGGCTRGEGLVFAGGFSIPSSCFAFEPFSSSSNAESSVVSTNVVSSTGASPTTTPVPPPSSTPPPPTTSAPAPPPSTASPSPPRSIDDFTAKKEHAPAPAPAESNSEPPEPPTTPSNPPPSSPSPNSPNTSPNPPSQSLPPVPTSEEPLPLFGSSSSSSSSSSSAKASPPPSTSTPQPSSTPLTIQTRPTNYAADPTQASQAKVEGEPMTTLHTTTTSIIRITTTVPSSGSSGSVVPQVGSSDDSSGQESGSGSGGSGEATGLVGYKAEGYGVENSTVATVTVTVCVPRSYGGD